MTESPGTHAERPEWERHEGVTVVECPSCAFCFDADHTDIGGGYSCFYCDDLVPLAADLEAVTRERDDLETEIVKLIDRKDDHAGSEFLKNCAEAALLKEQTRRVAAEQRLEATKDALREIAEHRQDRSYNHATAHAYADVRDIARAALAEDKPDA